MLLLTNRAVLPPHLVESQNIGDFADCRAVSGDVAFFKMVEAEGLEPTTH